MFSCIDVYELRVPWLQIVGGAGETTIVRSTLVGFRKALPRLPSVDDVCFDLDDLVSEDGGGNESDMTTPTMPKHHPHLIGPPPSMPTTLQIQCTVQELFPSPPPFAVNGGTDRQLAQAAGKSAAALPGCRAGAVCVTPIGTLNNVWCMFMIAANAEK
ncbi:hypothetical protein B0H14DRAFT_2631246 [Mycena olivaceomarginata]|nr:hypothetical protein B0H14DRAFT_2631246 [Mycena olivaceomarginata]